MSTPLPQPLPLSVWPTAQRTARVQRAGRYLPTSVAHPGKMLPAIAARAIAAYTQPGDLVVDPMCGIGTTLVEAVHLGRDAIGVEYEPAWSELAADNLTLARAQGATGHGEVITGDARHLTGLLDPAAVRGLVALVLTSPPYGPSVHGQVTARPGAGVAKSNYRYSTDRANLAHVGQRPLLDAMRQIFTQARRVLRPGGIVAMTVRPYWHAGTLVDLPGALTRTGQDAGLELLERNVALLAALTGDHLVPRSSFFALDQVRRARARGVPRSVIAHEDLLVFQAGQPRWHPDSSSRLLQRPCRRDQPDGGASRPATAHGPGPRGPSRRRSGRAADPPHPPPAGSG